ncbi:uncharacterized protein LOC133889506 [Phragmites australis]|uniref:uncharacterized protein LOC133889506 n=1 Tax=Phragmites australis TaxID=29695 RepID=UPI002D78E584|nr:uncharacterized protein LOC133889506 [Phragmites australis]
MRKEIIIRMQPDSDKCHKALKVAASVSGVDSVTLSGGSKDLLLVIGDDVDARKLTRKLEKEVGEAEIVELRTVPGAALPPGASKDVVVTQSPYHWHHPTPGRSVPGGGRIECPVAAARWPGEHSRQAVIYYHRTPSPGYHHLHYAPSPMAGQAGPGDYGYAGSSIYARAVARSHPANYSPMIARHDFRAVGRPRPRAEGGRHGRGDPNCCTIL